MLVLTGRPGAPGEENVWATLLLITRGHYQAAHRLGLYVVLLVHTVFVSIVANI